MLYMTRTFQFCSISHQQGLLVLNLMREAFDEEDLETMKTFVREELEADNNFHFRSGRVCSRANLGQIIKIAFELRTITQKALDDLDSDEDEEALNQESIEKRSQMQQWFHFCNSKVAAIEKVWNQKLDKPDEPAPNSNSNNLGNDDSNKDDHEQTIEDMLAKLSNSGRINNTKRGNVTGGSQRQPAADKDSSALQADIEANRKDEAKDDFHLEPKTGEYGDNQFWKQPEMYDIDDLLAELDDGQ